MLLWVNDAAAVADGAPRSLATVISSPTTAASVVAARLVTYEKGVVSRHARDFPRNLFQLYRCSNYVSELSLPLFRSISTFRSHSGLRRVVRMLMIARHYDESAIIDGEGGIGETG